MFEKRKKALRKPNAPLMFYTDNDLFYNSFLTEALDAHSIRCLHFILKKTNNTKEAFPFSYNELKEGAELSCNNYVQKALKKLTGLGLVEVKVVKKVQSIRVLKTAKRLRLK